MTTKAGGVHPVEQGLDGGAHAPRRVADCRNPHPVRWAATVGAFDAFVVVSPEYNHSIPAVLKNAVDYLDAEWHGKTAGLVTYGVSGGSRAADHLRLVLAEVRLTVVPSQVELSLFQGFDFGDTGDPTTPGVLVPRDRQEQALSAMLTELLR